jgi:hypothetical protein
MNDVPGLKHFSDYFLDCNTQFVIIGGVATNYFLIENDRVGRRTRDIDLVVLANPNRAFADKLREYITAGRYQIESDSGGNARNYRFRNPEGSDFPKQIEIFSTAPISLALREGQFIVPFATTPGLESLSAILMDEDYFALVKSTNVIRRGMSLLGGDGLVPLKARAFLDLEQRRRNGERVDVADIKKHRNDVLRLSQTFGLESFELSEPIKKDLRTFINHPDIKALDIGTLLSIVPGVDSVEAVLQLMIEHFKL